jgi:uncharacterized membrane protein
MVTGIFVLVVSALVVLLTSLFKTVNMSVKVKTLIATVLSVIGGVGADLASKGFDVSQYAGLDILTTALVIYGGSQLIYNFIMKGTSVDAKLEDTLVTSTPADAEADSPREGF